MKTIVKYIIWLLLLISVNLHITSCGNDKPDKVEFKDENNPNGKAYSKKGKKKLKISKNIKLTKHAKCRMKCRGIDIDEIEEVLVDGKINNQKSDKPKKKGDCPTYAVEHVTKRDKQQVRVVIAACEKETKIVTVIDLGVKVDNCPGDCK
jgi:uncharacterized protein YxeA